MYRQFLTRSVPAGDLKTKNRYAPPDVRYCNFLCQDFRDKSSFSPGKNMCNTCRGLFIRLEQARKSGEITYKQFRENPSILDGLDGEVVGTKICRTCKQELPDTSFAAGRRMCRGCKAIQASERDGAKVDKYIESITKVRGAPSRVKEIAEKMPKGSLTKVISHFEVGRKSTDTKADMVHNLMLHFQKDLHPNICRGGCGRTLPGEYQTCERCTKKKARSKRPLCEFRELIPGLIQELKEIREEDDHLYNMAEVRELARALELPFKQLDKKAVIVTMINDEFKKRRENLSKEEDCSSVQKTSGDVSIPPEKLDFDGTSVKIRHDDGYLHATSICKAGSRRKLIADWLKLPDTKELIRDICTELKVDPSAIVERTRGSKSGTWVHPELAVDLAMWVDKKFKRKVCKWIEEWASYCPENRAKLTHAYKTLQPTGRSLTEQRVVSRLVNVLGGETEIPTACGNVDIVTGSYIIEVKELRCWKHALGQVLAYKTDTNLADKKMRIHLFTCEEDEGEISQRLEIARRVASVYGIEVTSERCPVIHRKSQDRSP